MPESRHFLVEFLRLAKQFWCSEQKRTIRGAALLLALLTMLQMVMAVLLNRWSAGLFDALEQHSMADLMTQIGKLTILFVCGMALTGSHLFVKRNLMISWRDWMTEYVFSRWMKNGAHYLISRLPGEHDNPDGRIAEDCRVATESAVTMAHSLFLSILMLIGFTKVLWSLSGVVTLDLGFIRLPIHGHLVWIAIVYAAAASWLGWQVSRPLTTATNERQSAEANFRASLLEARENSQAIALIRGEPYERSQFSELFRTIRQNWNKQTATWRNILMFTTGYSIFSMAFPILVSSPRYILGKITLGTLMQSAQAFQHMASSLSWPVNNAGGIAEWRASVERILNLLKVLDDLDAELARPDHLIEVRRGDRPVLAFRDLKIVKYDGTVVAQNINVEIGKGERVLITGNTFTGAKLFRAIAGIRPWGKGVIELPAEGRLFFMPPWPHLPAGTLRNAICYPSSRRVSSEEEIVQAMRLAGLPNLIDKLDKSDKWAHTLSRQEMQRLGMVRLLLNRPQWIFLQEAFDSLEPQDEEHMMRLICNQFPDATLLTISHMPDSAAMHTRSLEL
jgi:putative ATP-binding cassette transporter